MKLIATLALACFTAPLLVAAAAPKWLSPTLREHPRFEPFVFSAMDIRSARSSAASDTGACRSWMGSSCCRKALES